MTNWSRRNGTDVSPRSEPAWRMIATSSSRRNSPSRPRWVSISETCSSTSGQSPRKRSRTSGSTRSKADVTEPMRSVPAMPDLARAATSAARSEACTSSRHSARNSFPASVSSTERLERFSSAVPSWRSSWRMAWLSGGWDMLSRSAARPKCSSSATAMKVPGLTYFDHAIESPFVLQLYANQTFTISTAACLLEA